MYLMADEPPGGDDVSGFRLPPIGLGRCMVPINGDGDAGCAECVASHYNGFARVTESGDEYYLTVDDCSRHYAKLGWRAISDKLRMEIKDTQGSGSRLKAYDRWVLERKRNLLSKYDTVHTSRDSFDMQFDMLIKTLAQ